MLVIKNKIQLTTHGDRTKANRSNCFYLIITLSVKQTYFCFCLTFRFLMSADI